MKRGANPSEAGLEGVAEKCGPGRLVGQREQHDGKVVGGQPAEERVALAAQHVSATEQQQGDRQVGGVDDVVLNGAQGHHRYQHDIRVVPAHAIELSLGLRCFGQKPTATSPAPSHMVLPSNRICSEVKVPLKKCSAID